MSALSSTRTILGRLDARFGTTAISVFVFLTIAIFVAALAAPWTRQWVILAIVSGALVATGLRVKWKDGAL